MQHPREHVSVGRPVRAIFGTATFGFLALGFVFDSPQLFAISGTCGIIWWIWDVLMDHVLVPGGDWLVRMLSGQLSDPAHGATRPSLEETIEFLENHIEQGASRRVEINSAIRLEEIYRTVKKDPEAAGRVILRVRERYPAASELKRYGPDGLFTGDRDPTTHGLGGGGGSI